MGKPEPGNDQRVNMAQRKTKSFKNLRVSEECDSISNELLPVCHVSASASTSRYLWVQSDFVTPKVVTLTFAFALSLLLLT